MMNTHADDRIVSLLTPSFLTKRPVDLDAVVRQLQTERPETPIAKLRNEVVVVAGRMRLRFRAVNP